MLKSKITIVGAGPGGAITALFLAKKGLPCTLVDKARFPRDKVCGDALSGKVVDVLSHLDPAILNELQKLPAALGSWGITFFSPDHSSIRIPFVNDSQQQNGAPPGFIAKRKDFDEFLLKQVRNAPGITLLEEFEIKYFSRKAGHWILYGKNGNKLQTSFLVIAGGANSNFLSRHGNFHRDPKHFAAAVRGYFQGVKGMDPQNFIELHFLKELNSGYFWIFPLADGGANVGIGMRSDRVSKRKVNLKKLLMELLRSHPFVSERFKDAELSGSLKGFGLPLGSKKRNISGEGFLLVGDAASLIDPFTGEGIGNAMLSGEKAAEVLEEAISREQYSARFLSKYDTKVYRSLGQELALSYKLQLLSSYPSLFNFVVRRIHGNENLEKMISRMFTDLELRSRLKDPRFYFKLLFNSSKVLKNA